jgi:hypothetical protein
LTRLERGAISRDDDAPSDVEAGRCRVLHGETSHERSFGGFEVYWIETNCEYFDQVLIGTRLG